MYLKLIIGEVLCWIRVNVFTSSKDLTSIYYHNLFFSLSVISSLKGTCSYSCVFVWWCFFFKKRIERGHVSVRHLLIMYFKLFYVS